MRPRYAALAFLFPNLSYNGNLLSILGYKLCFMRSQLLLQLEEDRRAGREQARKCPYHHKTVENYDLFVLFVISIGAFILSIFRRFLKIFFESKNTAPYVYVDICVCVGDMIS